MSRNAALIVCVMAVGGVLTTSRSEAAKVFGPPSEALLAKHVIVIRAEAREKQSPDRVVFAKQEVVRGEAPEVVTLRLDSWTFEAVEVGGHYLIGYSHFREHPLFRSGLQEDPEGPKLVQLPGVGPALLEDTPSLRLLVTSPAAEGEDDERQRLDAALAQLRRDDPLSRRFAAVEVLTRPELRGALREADAATLRASLRAASVDPLTRDFLLQIAVSLPQPRRGDWLAEVCREILDSVGTQYDLTSPVPALVVTITRVLSSVGSQQDLSRLSPLLLANNSGVSKAALQAMNALDPDAALEHAKAAYAREDLLPETRRALGKYLERRGSPGR